MPNRISFTPMNLKRLPVPERAANGRPVQVDYWDETTKGFGLRVSSTGRKTWTLLTRVHGSGEQIRVTLGDYAERETDLGLTLAQARAAAKERWAQARAGHNPNRAAAQARSRIFSDVAQEFLDKHCRAKNRRPRTIEGYKHILEGEALRPLAPRPLASITHEEFQDVLDSLAKRAPIQANRTLAVVRKMMKWAKSRKYLSISPVADIERPSEENRRNRHLFGHELHGRPSEIALAWRAFDAAGPFAPVLKLMALTGQREREVAGMRWAELLELNGSQPRWLIPEERAKNNVAHIVPLGPTALEILRVQPRLAKSPFVFTTTGETPVSGFSWAKRKVDAEIKRLKAEGVYPGQFEAPWVFHDLRRTLKTGLNELGIRKDVRDALLNHMREGVDAHYDHAALEKEKREAVLVWDDFVNQLIGVRKDMKSQALAFAAE